MNLDHKQWKRESWRYNKKTWDEAKIKQIEVEEAWKNILIHFNLRKDMERTILIFQSIASSNMAIATEIHIEVY